MLIQYLSNFGFKKNEAKNKNNPVCYPNYSANNNYVLLFTLPWGVDDNFAFTEVNLLFCVSVANGLHLCCPFFMFCACVSIILRTHKSTFRLMQPWTPITMSASHKTLSLNVIWRWIHFNLRALWMPLWQKIENIHNPSRLVSLSQALCLCPYSSHYLQMKLHCLLQIHTPQYTCALLCLCSLGGQCWVFLVSDVSRLA